MYRLWLFFLFLSIGLYGAPPPVPSAGIIERELEKEYEANPIQPEREIPDLQIDIPEEHLELEGESSLRVNEIELRGNEAISTSALQVCFQEFLGRSLTLKEIYALCSEIDRVYAKKGFFLARAYPPAQEVREGVLVIEVIEGRLGTVLIEGEKFYSERFIESYFNRLRGSALNYDTFMRALLLLNETDDLSAAAVFVKGKELGTADVVVKVQDRRPVHLYLNANNYGKDLTTNFRAGGRLDWGSLFTYGDRLAIAEVVGFPINALYFTDVIYRVPLNRNGTFCELAYLFSKFKVEEFTSLNLRGESNIGTFKVTHALTRSRRQAIDFFGNFDLKQIENFALGTLTSFDKLRVATVGVTVDQFGLGKGRNYLNARCGVGIPDFLGGMNPVDSECSRVGGGGLFFKANLDFDRFQPLATDWILRLHGSGQWSPYKLAVPEQIYIGGSDTVRGFPLAVALGDSGYYANGELLFPPPLLSNYRCFRSQKKWREVLQLAAFVDTGGVFFNGGSHTFLSGSGFGFRFKGPLNLSLSFDMGFPLNQKTLSTGSMIYIKVTGQCF